MEDLWAFNHESVARAIFGSTAPVISGVGHETDFTIADFTADLRAPTPTAAAELAVPDQQELKDLLLDQQGQLLRAAMEMIEQQRWTLTQRQHRLQRSSPSTRLASAQQKTDELYRQAERAVEHHIALAHTQLQGVTQQLTALNPAKVLERGYAVVTHKGTLVKRTQDVQPGDAIKVQVSDGAVHAEVTENGERNE